MGLSKLIHKGVKKAFRGMGDLAEVGVLVKRTASFNFSTGALKKSDEEVETVMLVSDGVYTHDGHKTTGLRLIVPATVGDISAFDRVVCSKGTLKIGRELSNNGFVITTTLTKEADG